MSVLRHRRHNILDVVQGLDAFPKVQESVQEEKRTVGGLFAIVFALIACWLLSGELMDYINASFRYRFSVDTEFDEHLQLNVDITIAMPCELLGVDVMDSTDKPILTMGKLTMEPTTFVMSASQHRYWKALKSVNQKHRPGVNPLENVFWIAGSLIRNLDRENEKRSKARGRKDSCRIHGSIGINKVSGNFHISVGRTLVFGGNVHAHLSFMLSQDMYNFSHRIEHFSFGSRVNELVHPLDGTEKIANKEMLLFQYYTKIVPIKLYYHTHSVATCQYSVTSRNRSIDHSKGSHGVPGLFFKYDFSALSVEAFENRLPPWTFIVRLCAIVGGVYVTSAILQAIVSCVLNVIVWRRYSKTDSQPKLKIDTYNSTEGLQLNYIQNGLSRDAMYKDGSSILSL